MIGVGQIRVTSFSIPCYGEWCWQITADLIKLEAEKGILDGFASGSQLPGRAWTLFMQFMVISVPAWPIIRAARVGSSIVQTIQVTVSVCRVRYSGVNGYRTVY